MPGRGGRCGDQGVSKADGEDDRKADASECLAHLIEARCLQRKLAECPTFRCWVKLQSIKNDALKEAEENCKRVGYW